MTDPLLQVRNLSTHFHTEQGTVKAVDGVSFDVMSGETLGIVGESGSGKSVTALSIIDLVDSPGRVVDGEVTYRGEDVLEYDENRLNELRGGEISTVFQDPMTSLNPVYTVGSQISRVIRKHLDLSKAERRNRVLQLMEDVGIPEPETRVDDYPHQFSGGMRQRILLAMAISCEPDLLIADEPTTALDVTIEAQIFELLEDLQEKYGMSIILITHDLGVVAGACDRVAVYYAGRIVERTDVDELFKSPKHPYTRGLLRSIPKLHDTAEKLSPISGSVPELTDLPSGCSFNPRCRHATEDCTVNDPELREVDPDHDAACIHVEGYRRPIQ